MDEKIDTYESEIKELKSQLDEKDVIAEKTKEYLFVLENQIHEKDQWINTLTDKCSNLEKSKSSNNEINNLKNEISSLKKQNKQLSDELRIMKSTVSWKITKPLRKLKKIIK